MPETQFQVLLAPVGDGACASYHVSFLYIPFFWFKHKQKMLVGSHQTTPLMYRDWILFPRKFKDEARIRHPWVVPELVISLPLIFLLQPNQTAFESSKYEAEDVRLTFHTIPLPAPSAPAAKPAYDQNWIWSLDQAGMARNIATDKKYRNSGVPLRFERSSWPVGLLRCATRIWPKHRKAERPRTKTTALLGETDFFLLMGARLAISIHTSFASEVHLVGWSFT